MTNRNRIIFAVSVFIIFSFCIEGWVADWKPIAKDSKGSVWEIDTASISLQPDDIVKIWLKKHYTKKELGDWVSNFGQKVNNLSYALSLEENHCKEKQKRVLSLTLYSLDGDVISSITSPGEWMFIAPDSLASDILEQICK